MFNSGRRVSGNATGTGEELQKQLEVEKSSHKQELQQQEKKLQEKFQEQEKGFEYNFREMVRFKNRKCYKTSAKTELKRRCGGAWKVTVKNFSKDIWNDWKSPPCTHIQIQVLDSSNLSSTKILVHRPL